MALYGIKDSGDLVLIDTTTGKQVLYSDYCNQTSINMTADVVYAMKKTARAIAWDTAKEGTLTTEMQVFDLRWIALLMGSLEDLDGNSKTVDWSKHDAFAVDASGKGKLNFSPKSGTITVYKLLSDGISLGAEVKADTGFTVSGTDITITGAKAGDRYAAFYLTEVEHSRTFTVSGNRYPHGYKAYLYTTIRDTSNNDTFVQFEFFNIKPKAQMELTMSAEDVCTLTVEWDMMVDNDNKFFTLTYLEKDWESESVVGGGDNDDSGDSTPAITLDQLEAVTAEELAVANVNPSTEGWYVSDGNGGYVLTEDNEVDGEQTYYKLKAQG